MKSLVDVEKLRARRFEQIPMLRAQVRTMRESANAAVRNLNGLENSSAYGAVLTSNYLSSFAVELGLKSFYYAFSTNDCIGHDLSKLYKNLPEQIQRDVNDTYEGTEISSIKVTIYAFLRSPTQPPVP